MQAKLTRTITPVAFALAVLMAAGIAAAEDLSGEVWLISTRRAPRCGKVESAGQQINYWRLQADSQWAAADGEAFLDTGARPAPTTIFIHGNREDRAMAIRSGWYVYRQMKRDAQGRPFRFVIWSWPSERIRGRTRRGVQVKASRSDVQSYYLAELLDRTSLDAPVSLIGYSFGARIITGALHLLAGGRLAGHSLPAPTDAERKPLRAVLVAAALDADWLLPGRRNGLALSQVERVLVTRNRCDPILKWYSLIYSRHGPQALGYAGPTCCRRAEKIEPLDLACSVGRGHAWACYAGVSDLRRRLAWYTFLESPQAEPPPEGPTSSEVLSPNVPGGRN